MLKKTVTASIIPSIRICKCGAIISIDPIHKKTICHNCKEVVYENTELLSRDDQTESKNSV